MARKTRKIALTRLEDHGLELRSDSRMCEEYIQYGGHIDAVVEMMIEMSSSLLAPTEFSTRSWTSSSVCIGETHTSIERCGSIESAGTGMRYPMKDMALDAYVKAGLGLLIPEHLVHV
jgi:hypothetical protein